MRERKRQRDSESERARERESEREREGSGPRFYLSVERQAADGDARDCRVCVRERERGRARETDMQSVCEREKERKRYTDRQTDIQRVCVYVYVSEIKRGWGRFDTLALIGRQRTGMRGTESSSPTSAPA